MQEDPLHDKNSVSERLLSTNYSPQPNVQYAPEFSHQGILGQIFTLTTIICTGLLIFVATIIGLTLYGIFGLAEVALGFISVTPTVVIFGLICFKVRHLVSVNRLAKFYLCGVIGVFPVMGIELGISALFNLSMKNVSQTTATAIVGSLFESFIVASLCEESIKLIIGLCARRGEKDIPYTISILCVAGALGLATLENLMYVYFTSFQSLLSAFVTSIMRAFLSVPLHASTAMIFGTEIAKMRFEMKHRLPFFFLCWIFNPRKL